MFPSCRIALWMAVLGLAAMVSGCSSQAPPEKQKPTTPAEKTAPDKTAVPDVPAQEGHEPAGATPTEVSKGLAELSADDRAAAEKQRVCPVSGDILGSQGKPYKVTVKGQVVFLCCPACEKPLLANPDKYLATLRADNPK